MAEKEDFRQHYQAAINRSEDDFEKNLIYLSAGSLALSLAFIEKIVPVKNSICLYLLITGWILLTLTLAINLVSHLISKIQIQKSQKDYDLYLLKKLEYKALISNTEKRNNYIDCINWISISLFIVGVSIIVIYTSINFNHMAKKSNDNEKSKVVKTVSVKLGRTIPKPQPENTVKISTEIKPKE